MQISNKFRAPLRSFVAISLGLICYKLIDTQYDYWILLSVIALLPSTTGATMKKAISRISGTLAGVLIGLLLVVVMHDSFIAFSLVIAISIFLMIYFIKSYYSIAMMFAGILIVAALTFFIAHGNAGKSWTFVLARFFDTVLGATIVIITAYLFWPDKTEMSVKRIIDKQLKNLYSILQLVSVNFEKISVDDFFAEVGQFHTDIINLQQNFGDMRNEPNGDFRKFDLFKSVCTNFSQIYNDLIAMGNFLADAHQKIFAMEKIKTPLQDFIAIVSELSNGSPRDLEKLNHYYTNLILQIRQLQEQQTSLFVDNKYYSVVIVLLSLRNICVNLQFILIAIEQLRESHG